MDRRSFLEKLSSFALVPVLGSIGTRSKDEVGSEKMILDPETMIGIDQTEGSYKLAAKILDGRPDRNGNIIRAAGVRI